MIIFFENPNDIYFVVCGDKLGKFYDYFSVFFLFLSYTVMVAGAQATAVEQYNSPEYIGGVILAVIVMATVYFGLDRIVDIIGAIGPVIVVLAIGVGLASILTHLDRLPHINQSLHHALNSGEMYQASSNFMFSAASYVGFCVIWLAAFVASLGHKAHSVKEGQRAILVGSVGFIAAVTIMTFAILLNIDLVHDSQIPTLLLARDLHPMLATIFSVTIFLGIFTTAVPLLWNVCARFAREKTTKYRLLTIGLGCLGAVIGLSIDFNQLVSVVYVLNGYIGFIFIALLIYRGFRRTQR